MIDERIVISNLSDKIILIYLLNDEPQQIKAYSISELTEGLRLGAIVNCRITKRLAGVNGCFLRYKKDGNGFINGDFKCESVHPFMYVKEGANDKKPLFVKELEISGHFSVVKLDGKCDLRISSKLNKADTNALRENFKDLAIQNNISILLRTSCKDASLELIEEEIKKNAGILNDILSKVDKRQDGYVFYSPSSLIVRDLSEIIKTRNVEIITDKKEIYDEIKEAVDDELKYAKDLISLRLYEDKLLDLSKLYRFEGIMSKALSRKVMLKDNAFLTFDRTEALIAIDVNSSGMILKNGTKEEANLKLNLLAAKEAIHQIILRNYSGIIIIDFINMNEEESYEVLRNELNSLLSKDVVKSKFHGFTNLGLAEISRQRKELSLSEKMR